MAAAGRKAADKTVSAPRDHARSGRNRFHPFLAILARGFPSPFPSPEDPSDGRFRKNSGILCVSCKIRRKCAKNIPRRQKPRGPSWLERQGEHCAPSRQRLRLSLSAMAEVAPFRGLFDRWNFARDSCCSVGLPARTPLLPVPIPTAKPNGKTPFRPLAVPAPPGGESRLLQSRRLGAVDLPPAGAPWLRGYTNSGATIAAFSPASQKL